MSSGVRELSRRVLNRTLLERQLLARRVPRTPLEAIEHLVAMQAQMPNGPYVGLWARLENFRPDDLTSLLEGRDVVHATMLRRTQHLARGEDFGWLWPTVASIVRKALTDAYYAEQIEGIDLDELARVGRRLLAGKPLHRRELGRLLADRFPGRTPGRLAEAVELLEASVHPPPHCTWGRWGHRNGTPLALADEWLGHPLADAPQPETMVLRYLAAFGPAGVMDIQAWSGLTRLREVVEGLRPKLRSFRDEQGSELFDLPDAPLGEPDRPAPVRLLPAFDNAVLGHRDRTRVISEENRRRITPRASAGVPVFLLDGFVEGTWTLTGDRLHIAPFRPLSDSETAAVQDEAAQLLRFVTPDNTEPTITLT
ncbi:winged helix DNA-binding domain-containing protein [Streptomyces alboflavus]|uniref:winged helix DNA-binding domain-containing protein n=1 Tax=Streptomyces alboflavus TaxID=67267 RepID=UPI0004C0677B|nr:winged helix DNA-binding domain-containing protein [Streptomyces alboflavus]